MFSGTENLKRGNNVRFSEVAIEVSPFRERLPCCIDVMSADFHGDLAV